VLKPEIATAVVRLLTLVLFLTLIVVVLLSVAIAVQLPSSPTEQVAVASAETETGNTNIITAKTTVARKKANFFTFITSFPRLSLINGDIFNHKKTTL